MTLAIGCEKGLLVERLVSTIGQVGPGREAVGLLVSLIIKGSRCCRYFLWLFSDTVPFIKVLLVSIGTVMNSTAFN